MGESINMLADLMNSKASRIERYFRGDSIGPKKLHSLINELYYGQDIKDIKRLGLPLLGSESFFQRHRAGSVEDVEEKNYVVLVLIAVLFRLDEEEADAFLVSKGCPCVADMKTILRSERDMEAIWKSWPKPEGQAGGGTAFELNAASRVTELEAATGSVKDIEVEEDPHAEPDSRREFWNRWGWPAKIGALAAVIGLALLVATVIIRDGPGQGEAAGLGGTAVPPSGASADEPVGLVPGSGFIGEPDTFADLLWYRGSERDGALWLVRNREGSGFDFDAEKPLLTNLWKPDWAAVMDADNDNRMDILWYERKGEKKGAITLLHNTGHNFELGQQWIKDLEQPDWAAVADIDHDGLTDILWFDSDLGGNLTLLRNTGTNFEPAGQWISNLKKSAWPALTDFDGDGLIDVLWYQNPGRPYIRLLRNTGSSFVVDKQLMFDLGPPTWAEAIMADGDALPDVVWYESWKNGGGVSVFKNVGGFLQGGEPQWIAGYPEVDRIMAGDLDHQGGTDLFIYEEKDSGTITALLNSGTNFAPHLWASAIPKPDYVLIADLDG